MRNSSIMKSKSGISQRISENPSYSENKTPLKSQNADIPSRSDPLFELVHEYLLKSKMMRTIQVFQQEMMSHTNNSSSVKFVKIDNEMLKAYQNGNHNEFFDLWDKFIPVTLRMTSDYVKKLEFYLQVYFLVYSMHPSLGKSKNLSKGVVERFKNYLETRGPDLAKTTELIPFFALPYIKNPYEHPTMKVLFTKEWTNNLRSQLEEFVSNLLDPTSEPVLLKMFYLYSKQSGVPASPHSSFSGTNNYPSNANLQSKVDRLQHDYNEMIEKAKANIVESQVKWIENLREVFSNCVDNLQKGLTVNPKLIEKLNDKLDSYEEFSSKNIENLLIQTQDFSVFDRPSAIGEHENENDNTQENNNSEVNLDYEKICFVLNSASNPQLFDDLLHALWLRIARVKKAIERRKIIVEYAEKDILGLKSSQSDILYNIFEKVEQGKENAMKLLNFISSDYYGRSYLLSEPIIISYLSQCLRQEKNDSSIRKNTLGTIQKFSLRRKPQIQMIEEDLILWIVTMLNQTNSDISEYSLEYSTALLMNLSLRSLGKEKALIIKEQIYSMLDKYLEDENLQVRTFINGTLYALLYKPEFLKLAKSKNLQAKLMSLLKSADDERLIQQLEYLLNQLNEEEIAEEEEGSEAGNDEGNDNEDLDPEDDEELDEEPDDDFNGKALLGTHFSIKKSFRSEPNIEEEQNKSNVSKYQPKNYQVPDFGDDESGEIFKSKPKVPRTPPDRK